MFVGVVVVGAVAHTLAFTYMHTHTHARTLRRLYELDESQVMEERVMEEGTPIFAFLEDKELWYKTIDPSSSSSILFCVFRTPRFYFVCLTLGFPYFHLRFFCI